MRRPLIAAIVAGLLVGACGDPAIPQATEKDLQRKVAWIRQAVEVGNVGIARGRLDRLAALVEQLLERGVIDQPMAMEILASADAVRAALVLAPSPTPSPTVTETPPPEEDEGDEGNSGEGKGKGKGKGDEGHGNDGD